MGKWVTNPLSSDGDDLVLLVMPTTMVKHESDVEVRLRQVSLEMVEPGHVETDTIGASTEIKQTIKIPVGFKRAKLEDAEDEPPKWKKYRFVKRIEDEEEV